MQQFGNCDKLIAFLPEGRDDFRQGLDGFAPIDSMFQIQPVVEQNDVPRLCIFDNPLGDLGTGDVIPIARIFRPAYGGEPVSCGDPEEPGSAEAARGTEKSAMRPRYPLQDSLRRVDLPVFMA